MGPNNICCFSVGDYTGWPACCVIAYKCPEVRVTIYGDEKGISELNCGAMSDSDPNIEQIIKRCRNRNLFFSSDYSSVLRDADLIFVSVNDSSKGMRTAGGSVLNLKRLEDTIKEIGLHLEKDVTIVENSRILVQAAERISSMLPPTPRLAGIRIQVISNPQFLSDGSALEDLLNPEGVLIGSLNSPVSRAAAESLRELYERWIPRGNIRILSDRSVELCKLAGSAFLAQRITNLNSLSELCEHTEADMCEISNILSKDSNIGSKLMKRSAGFGLFQQEISTLISFCRSLKLTEVASYWQAVIDLNEYLKDKCFRKIESVLGPPRGKSVAIWGFAYEKDTHETRNSPAVEICQWLLTERSKIKIYDPQVPAAQIRKNLGVNELFGSQGKVEICKDAYSSSAGASVVIICTDWDEFVHLDYSRVARKMHTPIIIDGRRLLKKESLETYGIQLHTIGLNYINM